MTSAPAPVVVNSACQALSARTDMASCSTADATPADSTSAQHPEAILQKNVTLHPCLPWTCYVAYPSAETATASTSTTNATIVVQDMETHQVLQSWTLIDLAACLYGETNPSKLPAAAKTLGAIISLDFLDPSTLFWNNGVLSAGEHPQQPGDVDRHFHWLVVQTSLRCLVLQIRQVSPYAGGVVLTGYSKHTRHAWLVTHLHEKTLGGGGVTGSIPSSNLYPLDSRYFLIGCADGSLKLWDCKSHQPIKSIKGLGKGDWIIQILSANPYNNLANDEIAPDSNKKRRILTFTKKGSVYLIELEIGSSIASQLDIKPPLARFSGGSPMTLPQDSTGASSKEKDGGKSSMDYGNSMLQYDAHRNWLLWISPAKKGEPITKLLVWNLSALQAELVKNQDEKSVFKPDPTLTIQFPAGDGPDDSSNMAVLPTVQHSAFSEDTILCAVATASGEFYLQAAAVPSSVVNNTAIASPVTGMNLSQLLERELSLDAAPLIRVSGMHSSPLGGRPIITVATNVGLAVLDLDVPITGARHMHLGAGLGSMGKSILSSSHSEIIYGSLDVLKANNPTGRMEAKNQVSVYESPPASHLPAEYQNRPFRLAPSFFPSPSGLYVCLYWPFEFRYEILHVPSVLQKVGQRGTGGPGRNPCVASGSGIIGFAWLGDEDDYAVIHADDLMEAAATLMAAAPVLVVPTAEGGLTLKNLNPANINVSNLMDIRASAMGVANLTTSAAKAATSVTMNATKAATSVTLNATKAATTATLTATKAATSATMSAATQSTKVLTKGVKKSFGIFGKKKKGSEGGIIDSTGDETSEGSTLSIEDLKATAASLSSVGAMPRIPEASKRHSVELFSLVPVSSQASELSSTIAAAASSSLGEISLRGGNRNPPTMIFGGPVLVVASRSTDDREGHAHFYTRKQGDTDNNASVYVSTGPTLPYPDMCTWDEDGRFCAVIVQNRVAIYLSEPPVFTLLGAVRVGGSTKIVSATFVHGVLFCCTWNSVYCIFLGDTEKGICSIDLYNLASSLVTEITATKRTSFTPPTAALPLIQPVVLGYQSGSLVVSSIRGLHAVPLNHPLLRIGTLTAGGQVERAVKWFDAVPDRDHEALATFLERRGLSDLAVQLPGLSLESILDICMRHRYIERLEAAVEEYGAKGLRSVDLGRGTSNGTLGPEQSPHSTVVCVAAYLLAHGKVELTRRLATELLKFGVDGQKDALGIATLLLPFDPVDASRLLGRAVEDHGKSDWLLGNFFRDHVVSGRKV